MSKPKLSSEMGNITQKWVELLTPFTRNYSGKLSASELARETSIPQQTASRYLDKLAEVNLIEYEKQGRNKLFFLSLNKQTAKILFNIIENQKALFLKSTKEISPILDDLLQICEGLIVFGSYSTATFNKESDLDIVILECRNKNSIRKIKERYSLEINEHYLTYAEFKKVLLSRNALSIEIAKNHVLFGNVSNLVETFIEAEASGARNE